MWVIGATQARSAGVYDRDHRPLYGGGVAVHLPDRRVVRVPSVRALKGASPDGRHLCSEGAVVGFDPDRGAVGGLDAVPGGDDLDLHHVMIHEGRRCLAVTARDEVWVGDRVHDVGVPGARAHPNHLLSVDGALWVTRGAAGDALRIGGDARPLADVVVHDGVVADDGVWFTAVDGRLVRLDPRTGRTVSIDLTALDDRAPPLGWCRGLAFGDGLVWVGFTRLRATRTRARLAWVRGALRGRQVATAHPTRLVAYDLAAGRKVREVALEPLGVDAVFGVVPLATRQRP